MAAPAVQIEPARTADAGQILTVQRAAYVCEAQLYGDPFITALVESLDQVRAAIDGEPVVLKASIGPRIVGAVRGGFSDRTCIVGRLVVAPDCRGQGIGTALGRALEAEVAARADTCAAFIGHLSEDTLRFFRRLGYAETHRQRVAAHLTQVHLRKAVRAGRRR